MKGIEFTDMDIKKLLVMQMVIVLILKHDLLQKILKIKLKI